MHSTTLGDIAAWVPCDEEQPLVGCSISVLPNTTELIQAWGEAWAERSIDFRVDTEDVLLLEVFVGTALSLRLNYQPEHMPIEYAAHVLPDLMRLLAVMVRDPDQRLWSLSYLSIETYRRVVYQWNDTMVGYPETSLQGLLEYHASQHPQQDAVLEGDQVLSYAAFNARVNQWAHYLRDEGVVPGVVVAVFLPRCTERLVALWAILKAGGTYLPLSCELPTARLRGILAYVESHSVDADAIFFDPS